MKTKLLRKIRKRFSWYLNSEKRPVLIDNYSKKVKTYGDIDLAIELPSDMFKEFKCLTEEEKLNRIWNLFKADMLRNYGYNKHVSKWRFRKAKRNYKFITFLNKKYKDE